MMTMQRIVLDKNTQIKNLVENCRKNGTAMLGRHTVEGILRRHYITEGEFGDLLHVEHGFETIINEDHYILSRSAARKVF